MASMINPGTSIHFDANALEEQDEQEQQKEDLKREQELHDLLSNELPDDLLDDCSSLSSRDSSGFESPTTKSSRNPMWQQFGWHHQNQPLTHTQLLTHTSTPFDSGVPSLKPPAPTRDYRLHQPDTPDHFEESDTESGDLSRPVQNGYHDNHHFGNNFANHHEQQYTNEQPEYHHKFHYRATQEHEEDVQKNDNSNEEFAHSNKQRPDWNGQTGKNVDTWVKNGQYYEPHNKLSDGYVRQQTYTQHVEYKPHQEENYPQNYADHNGQVHSENGGVNSVQEEEIRLQQFMNQGGSNDTRQLGQLQILYKARGRELEELRQKLKQVTEEGARQTRVLNHQLAIADGEKSRLNLDLKQNKEQLQKCVHDSKNLKQTINTYEENIQELMASKQQLANDLEELKANNEALNHQLIQLNKSQTIARSHDRYDAQLAELQRRQQQEVYEFETKLDKLNASLQEKESELSSQKEVLGQLKRDQNREKLEMTETIGSLTRKLDETQRQCRDLLDTGSVQEIGQLKLHLQQAISSKTITESMCQALQDELGDVKEELRMYEAAAGLGVGPSKSPNGSAGDSYIQRNLAKENWKTPRLLHSSKLAPDDLLSGLKTELERSLTSNRSKRGQVTRLQNELKGVKEELANLKKNIIEMETELKDKEIKLRIFESQDKPNDGSRVQAENLRSELIQTKEECAQLREENAKLKSSLRELEKKTEELSKKNAELKIQMSEMITQHDEDSKMAVDRCRTAVLQLHEDSSKNLRQEMVREWEDEKVTLKEAYGHRLQQLKEENDRIVNELDDVKDLYVKVCEEKNKIEDTVRSKMTENAERQLKQTIEELEKHNEEKLNNIKNSLETDNRVAMAISRKKIMEVKDEEVEKLVEEKLSLAKADWMLSAQRQARESATKAAEAEWEARLEAEVNKNLEDKVTSVRKEVMEEYKQKLSQEKDLLKTTHADEIESAVRAALSRGESEWQSKQEITLKELVASALEKERESILGSSDVQKKIKDAVMVAKVEWSQEIEKLHGSRDSSRRLSQLQTSWKREMEVLEEKKYQEIEALKKKKDQEKQDALDRLRRDNDDSLQMTLEEQKVVLTEALKSAREAFDNEKTKILKQRDLEHSISEAKLRTKLLEEWSVSKRDAVEEKVNEEQARWQKERQALEERYTDQLNALEKEKERIIKQQEETQKEYNMNHNDASRKTNLAHDTWEEEKHRLLLKLEETEESKQKMEEKVESYKRKFTREHNKLIEKAQLERQRLQRKLKMTEKELEQTEYTMNKELEHLKDQLRSEGSVAMETMQAKMAELQRRHTVAIDTQEKKHTQERKRWRLEHVKVSNNSIQTQTMNTPSDATDGLQELRSHYLATVNKIKDDVLQHVEKTREQCRETVRKEVIKERHATAKKLRKYYLQCLQQLLEDDRKGQSNGAGTMLSTANKLAAMASALELSPERAQQTTSLNFHPEGVTRSLERQHHHETSSSKSNQMTSIADQHDSKVSSRPLVNLKKQWSSESSLSSFLDTDGELNHRRSDPTDSRRHLQSSKHSSSEKNRSDINFGSLESLSMSPREFNPMPEKPMSSSPQKAGVPQTIKSFNTRSHTDQSKTGGNITVRSRRHEKGQSSSSDNQKDKTYYSNSLQSKPCDNKLLNTSNSSINRIPSQYADNISARNSGRDPQLSTQSSFRSVGQRGSAERAQMRITHRTQIPTLCNLSSASILTEYNELPPSLDSSLSPTDSRESRDKDFKMFVEYPRQTRTKLMT